MLELPFSKKKISFNRGLRSPVINIPIVLIYQKRKNESKITKIANKEGDSRTKKRLQKKKRK